MVNVEVDGGGSLGKVEGTTRIRRMAQGGNFKTGKEHFSRLLNLASSQQHKPLSFQDDGYDVNAAHILCQTPCFIVKGQNLVAQFSPACLS